MNIPQALGYTKIAGMPVVAGFYTLLLPLLAFAVFGSSRYLVVAADSATASILAGKLATMAPIASPRYVALASTVALLTAGFLLLARVLRLGFLADFFIANRTDRVSHRSWISGGHRRAERDGRTRSALQSDDWTTP
jgi:MFS superfamily sulfate permease-like transporter